MYHTLWSTNTDMNTRHDTDTSTPIIIWENESNLNEITCVGVVSMSDTKHTFTLKCRCNIDYRCKHDILITITRQLKFRYWWQLQKKNFHIKKQKHKCSLCSLPRLRGIICSKDCPLFSFSMKGWTQNLRMNTNLYIL
jgi:hypothetical protein